MAADTYSARAVKKGYRGCGLSNATVEYPSRDNPARQVAEAPDRIALVDNGASWSYLDLEQRVREIAAVLSSFGIRAGDINVLRLETGIHQVEAINLYQRFGFERIEPFGPYRVDPLSLCFEKRLT